MNIQPGDLARQRMADLRIGKGASLQGIQTSHLHTQKHFIKNAIEIPRDGALKGLHNTAQGNALGNFKTIFAA